MSQPNDRELLKQLAAMSNNVIMKGSFSGDDIHEASNIMGICMEIIKQINEAEENERKTK